MLDVDCLETELSRELEFYLIVQIRFFATTFKSVLHKKVITRRPFSNTAEISKYEHCNAKIGPSLPKTSSFRERNFPSSDWRFNNCGQYKPISDMAKISESHP